MKTLTIFPYNSEVLSILQFRNMLDGYQVAAVLSFNEHAAQLQKCNRETGIFCTTNIEEALAKSDEVLLANNFHDYSLKKYYDVFETAKKSNKRVIMSKVLWHQMFPEIEPDSHVQLLGNQHNIVHKNKLSRLLEIPVPIVTVMGIGENCNKLECQLLLKTAFEKRGYDAYSISSNDLGHLFAMGTYPDFMVRADLSFPEKVLQLNHYMYDLCEEHQPDVILLGLSSGIAPLTEYDHNYFSETLLVAASALKIDVGILCHYYLENYEEMPFEKTREFVLAKYAIPIEAFFMSRQRASYNGEFKKMDYLFLEDEFIKKNTRFDTQFPIASSADPIQTEKVFNTIITKLENNLKYV